MAAEDWELRREARRCTYSAHQAETPGGRRMMMGYARFYSALAENAGATKPANNEDETALNRASGGNARPRSPSPRT